MLRASLLLSTLSQLPGLLNFSLLITNVTVLAYFNPKPSPSSPFQCSFRGSKRSSPWKSTCSPPPDLPQFPPVLALQLETNGVTVVCAERVLQIPSYQMISSVAGFTRFQRLGRLRYQIGRPHGQGIAKRHAATFERSNSQLARRAGQTVGHRLDDISPQGTVRFLNSSLIAS